MEYFNKLLASEERRRELLERVNEMELLTTSTGAIRYDRERVDTSPTNKQEDMIIQLADMKTQYAAALNKANRLWMEADQKINHISKYERRMVLRLRYMTGTPKRLRWVADEMAYSLDRVKHIHTEALKEFEDKFLS